LTKKGEEEEIEKQERVGLERLALVLALFSENGYSITVKDLTGDDHRLGPFIPLARTRQYSVPMGRSTVGVNVDSNTVLVTTSDVNVPFLDTWMV